MADESFSFTGQVWSVTTLPGARPFCMVINCYALSKLKFARNYPKSSTLSLNMHYYKQFVYTLLITGLPAIHYFLPSLFIELIYGTKLELIVGCNLGLHCTENTSSNGPHCEPLRSRIACIKQHNSASYIDGSQNHITFVWNLSLCSNKGLINLFLRELWHHIDTCCQSICFYLWTIIEQKRIWINECFMWSAMGVKGSCK